MKNNRPKQPKYCCICKGIYRGQVIDGRTISLHRFPQNKVLKRVWINRCKTVMRTFMWTEHKRLCSEHFVGFLGPSSQHTLPILFPTEGGRTKEFPSSNLDENLEVDDTPILEEPMETSVDVEQCGETTQTNFSLKEDEHYTDASLHLHDYCQGPVLKPRNPNIRCMDTQTECAARVTEVQTEESLMPNTSEGGTQTELVMKDFGVQCNLPILTFDDIKHDDDLVSFYTGIPSRHVFEAVFDEIKDEAEARTSRRKLNYEKSSGGRPRTIGILNEFFMVLMRLRLGLLIEDLSFRFCISSSQCSDIIERWINYLYVQLSFLVRWTPMSIIKENMPLSFKQKFPNTRVIIDCIEVFSESSSTLSLKSLMYSDYKSHMTYKALVGISPNGVVTFVSDCWTGSISDKCITQKSGLLDLLEEGDAIMADKGFTISDLTTPRGIALIIPPFKKKDCQFTKREVYLTKEIASLRIHVEREMERIKNFRILQGNIPISQGRRISKVFKICTYLTNLWPPLIQN